jgi:hypothetical protein
MALQVVTSSGYVQVVSNTATVSSVAASTTVVTLQAANTDRIHLSVFNDSTSPLYLKWGAGASTKFHGQDPARRLLRTPAGEVLVRHHHRRLGHRDR